VRVDNRLHCASTALRLIICDGKTNKAIREELFVSVNIAKTYVLGIYKKPDVNNRAQALKKVGKLHLGAGL